MKRIALILIATSSSVTAFAQLYFAPRVDYTLPATSTFVNYSFGDFNKDNKLDMVVSNFSAASISVFLGNGDGTFGTPQTFATGSGSGGSSVFDFNGDGNLDIAVTNYNANSTGIFLGNGAGSFATMTTFATGSGPQSPILGDYNEDGKIDIAVANWTANTITFHSGDGTGSFTPAGSVPTGPNPGVLAVDLNKDNHLDLVVLNTAGGNVSIRTGTGTGTFSGATNYTTGTNPRGLAIADFNGDNNLDIAVGNVNSNTISLLTGLGTGVFNAAVNFTTGGPSTLINGDFNADGIQDLAVSNTGNNTVSIYTGNGNGTFGLYQYTSVGSSPNFMRLAIVDLNNDSKLDIVTSNDNSNLVGVLLGNVPLPNAGTALDLNGTNQRADLGTWFNAPSFTVSLWVKPGAAQSVNAAIVDNNYTAAKSWTFQQNGAATNQYFFDHNGGTSNQVTLTAGVWQHVALVSANGIFSIYLNGQFVDSRNGGPVVYDGSQSLRLGNTAGTQYWNGSLDEVRFYNTSLTQAQIQASLCSEIPSTTPNLIAYYHLNEGTGTSIYDATTGSHTGTLVNGPVFSLSGVTVPIPTISGISPASGYPGSIVTITGTNFNPTAVGNDVLFNGTRAIVASATSTTLKVVVPATASTGTIAVTENCKTATSSSSFTVVPNRVVSFEHFIDIEPGLGNGTITPITPAAVVTNQDVPVDVTGFTVGNHTLYLRAKDNNGRINQVFTHSFAILPAIPIYNPCRNIITVNGSTDYVEVADNTSLRLTSLTLEAMVNFNSLGGTFQYIMGKPYQQSTGTAESYSLHYASGTLVGGINPSAPTLSGTFVPVVGAWYHIAMTYNQSNGQQRLYVNGSLIATGTAPVPTYDTGPLLIGSDIDFNAVSGSFNGAIDEVRVWNIVRTATELTAAADGTLTGNEPGLIAYYKMDETGQGPGLVVKNSASVSGTLLDGSTKGSPAFSYTGPLPPLTTGASACGPASVSLSASGATNGQYRWYSTATGGTAIAGETNASFTTPILTSTTGYFTSVDNGVCESTRAAVSATIHPAPLKPVINSTLPTSGIICDGSTVTLNAPPGFDSYLWSTGSTNASINVSSAGNFSVTVTDAFGCTSVSSDILTVGVIDCSNNHAPVIAPANATAGVQGSVSINLLALLSDQDDNIDLTSLSIVTQPQSGAVAAIGPGPVLLIDYQNVSFVGTDHLTIRVCDLAGACAEQQLDIVVAGDVEVFNGLSPNGDGMNDAWIVQHIELLEETKSNHVTVYNRWGDEVFQVTDYNNTTRVFRGIDKSGQKLPSGTYFYKIQFVSGHAAMTGYLEIK